MTVQFAPRITGIPVVQSALDRSNQFPTPQVDQRIHRLDTGAFERWDGTQWVTDLGIPSGRTPTTFATYTANNAVFNAMDYDSTAIADKAVIVNAAITAASAAGGGTVRIPAAMTCATQTAITMASNVALVGDGDQSIITAGSTSIAGIITVPSGAVNWKVSSLAVQGAAATGVSVSHAAVYVQQTNAGLGGAGVVKNVTALNANAKGVSIFVKIEPNNPFVTVRNNKVFGLYGASLTGTGYGVLTTSDHTSVTNNTFQPPTGEGRNGVYISGTATSGVQGAKVLGNTFVGFTNVVITGHSGGTGTVDAIIQGNVILGHAPLNATVSAIGLYGAFNRVSIDNNSITSTGAVGLGIAILSAGDITSYTLGQYASITNNKLYNIGGHGIDIEGAAASGGAPNQYPSWITVQGNTIVGAGASAANSYSAIKVACANYATIVGNQIDGQSLSLYGVLITATSPIATGTLVSKNTIQNCFVSISDQGSGSVVADNPGYNPVGLTAPSVGASPWTFTNGSTRATLYIRGGTVSSVTKNGSTLASATNCSVLIEPHQSVIVTYSAAPTAVLDTQ